LFNGKKRVADSQKFKDQLPRYNPWSAERWLAIAGSIGGIAALVLTVFHPEHLRDDVQTFILLVELSLLCAGLLLYLWVTSRKKLHRYAQASFFVHYVSHLIRDEVAAFEAGSTPDPKAILQDIVDAVASCFSVLTARRARCCIQEIKAGGDVVIVVRDSITTTQSPPISNSQASNIENNTDYKSIWYGTNGCPRFFVCRNLVALWRNNKYRNSSFEAYGEPTTFNFFGMTWVRKWTLPYKATIVWPIRYVPKEATWPALNPKPAADDNTPYVWGFLCVDWGSRNSFDETYSPELGAAFADAIFMLLHALRHVSAVRSPKSQADGVKVG
jgi:hypothetical protein